MIAALVVLVLIVILWRRLRTARQRQAAAVTAAPVVQAMTGVQRRVRIRGWSGSGGSM